jgi:serine/threonine protein kinase
MGVVYMAEHTRLHRFVALKFMPKTLPEIRSCSPAFSREAQSESATESFDHRRDL